MQDADQNLFGLRRKAITTPSGSSLSIREIADRTGIPQATLRTWEARYGFPVPQRLPGGHRRYDDRAVAEVLEVLRHREQGMSLEAAIRRAERGRPTVAAHSPFVELRRRHPALTTQVVTKTVMLALTRAVEDQCCAHAERPMLLATFQRCAHYESSRARWEELARTAAQTLVFADFPQDQAAGPPGPGPVRVPVPYDAPLNREWTLICDSREHPACVVGWERPGQLGPDSKRRYELLWSVDPVVVRDASQALVKLGSDWRPEVGGLDWSALERTPAPASPDLRQASGVLDRMIGYLDATVS